MQPISCERRRFPPHAIRLAVWLDFRVTTSLRNVEDVLAERGRFVRQETVRRWASKVGPGLDRAQLMDVALARLETYQAIGRQKDD